MLQLSNIDFGNILSDLLVKDDLTDLMIWNKEIWVSDVNLGHYHYEINKYDKEDIEQLYQLLYKLPRQIAVRMQVSYNEASPIVDGQIKDDRLGLLRFNCIHENLTGNNCPAIAIRKSKQQLRISKEKMIKSQYCDKNFFTLMERLVKCGCNIMISGITGSGKTELLRFLAGYIDDNQAIITIEDTLEAYLEQLYPKKNVLSLKTNDYYSVSDLLKPCLRENPDWICVSETRGKEIIDLLEAASTGHHFISTIHCDGASNIPLRIVEMSKMVGEQQNSLIDQIYQHIDIGIYINYYNDELGSHRKIMEIVEFYQENGINKIHELYCYDKKSKKMQYQEVVSNKIQRKIDFLER